MAYHYNYSYYSFYFEVQSPFNIIYNYLYIN